MKPRQFTVVLRRPTHMLLSEGFDPVDDEFYVAVGVEALSVQEAVRNAGKEALKADKKEHASHAYEDYVASDYEHVVVFNGAHAPVLFAFQKL
jgi:hypothetical protein